MGYFLPRIRHPRRSEQLFGETEYRRARERRALRAQIADALEADTGAVEAPAVAEASGDSTVAAPEPETPETDTTGKETP